MIEKLYEKDTIETYEHLKKLEIRCSETDELLDFFDDFLKMLGHEKSYVRVRGFRLICSLAKWDKNNKIDNNIEKILEVFQDDNAVAIRQYLKAISSLLLYKDELYEKIEIAINNIKLNKYKESMQSLIQRDINEVLR